jgi:dynein heavy chain
MATSQPFFAVACASVAKRCGIMQRLCVCRARTWLSFSVGGGGVQAGFKTQLLSDVRGFVGDVVAFRRDYLANGPMAPGITPQEAIDRLRRYHEELELFERRQTVHHAGQVLFAVPKTPFGELDTTQRELALLDTLYGTYKEVVDRETEWRSMLWVQVPGKLEAMLKDVEGFSLRCKRMPATLRGWEAFKELKHRIEDLQMKLPLFASLAKPAIRDRHWEMIREKTGSVDLNPSDPEFTLGQLLSLDISSILVEMEEVADGAEKELAIEVKLSEMEDKWRNERFRFVPWRDRGVNVFVGTAVMLEELEEASISLQTMLTMKHVAPFVRQATLLRTRLSDTTDTVELWGKVQSLWCSLESVFLGGDIARQMPVVARRFQRADRDWTRVMASATAAEFVLEACGNEVLVGTLPNMFTELEKCQNNLEGYLEQKRSRFSRFYFVSDPVLLKILSQGSDPQAVQPYYEKIFDAVSVVAHDPKDPTRILEFVNRDGGAEERIGFANPVKAVGNIEDWLLVLLHEMQRTMKLLCEECAFDMQVRSHGTRAHHCRGVAQGRERASMRASIDGAARQEIFVVLSAADCGWAGFPPPHFRLPCSAVSPSALAPPPRRWCPTFQTSYGSLWTSIAHSTRCWACSLCGRRTWRQRWRR